MNIAVTDGTTVIFPVDKGFVEVNGGLVHYVRRGTGPALVMLHAAPCSAKVMEPLQEEWAPYFTTYAFDLPGFGLSDAPSVDPVETHHLADTIVAAVKKLGLTSITLYGRHTGAGVSVEIARRHPELCAFVLTDGYPVFSSPYDEKKMVAYLTPITPTWDGGHLTWSWFRYREQHMFWPWNVASLATRADTDIPDVDFLYRGTIELLEARETYAAIYASAFRHPGLKVIDEVKVPVCYGNRPGDSQFKTMKLYPAHAWVHEFSRDGDEAAVQELEILRTNGKSAAAPTHRSGFKDGGATIRDYVPGAKGPIYARGFGLDQKGVPLLYLPDLPGGVDLHIEEMKALSRSRPVLGFDFYGNGNSVAAGHAISIALYVEQLHEVVQFFGWQQVQLYAHGTSAAVAVEFAKLYPALVGKIVLRSPPAIDTNPQFAAAYAPDITPEWAGGNFLKLWHHLRDQELWYPWDKRTVANAKKTEPRIDPDDLHRRAVVMLRQPAQYRPIWSTVLGYDLVSGLAALQPASLVVSAPSDVFAFAAERAANAFKSAPTAMDSVDSWLG
jgi:pimeloyl-ACP methyl ester carboxylesterase